jgi:hypothetical protein
VASGARDLWMRGGNLRQIFHIYTELRWFDRAGDDESRSDASADPRHDRRAEPGWVDGRSRRLAPIAAKRNACPCKAAQATLSISAMSDATEDHERY